MSKQFIWSDQGLRHWLAGLYEGEGWCGSTQWQGRPHLRYLNLRIQMTDEDVVQRAHEVTGVGKVTGPLRTAGPAHHKPQWRWQVGVSADAYAVLIAMFSLLGARRRQQIVMAVAGWRSSTPRVFGTAEELFWSHVEKDDDHWHWRGHCDGNGYGHYAIPGSLNRDRRLAHRHAYELTVGPLGRARLSNRCGARNCVRPEHWNVPLLEAEDQA